MSAAYLCFDLFGTLKKIPTKPFKIIICREGGRILRLGGAKKNFPGRGVNFSRNFFFLNMN